MEHRFIRYQLAKTATTDIWLERNLGVKVINTDKESFYICFQNLTDERQCTTPILFSISLLIKSKSICYQCKGQRNRIRFTHS